MGESDEINTKPATLETGAVVRASRTSLPQERLWQVAVWASQLPEVTPQ
jgi:hypothetical protein